MSFLSARKKTRLKQKQVAAMLGVTNSAVHNWESGKNYPRIATLKTLTQIYNCSIADLLEGECEDAKDKHRDTAKGAGDRE